MSVDFDFGRVELVALATIPVFVAHVADFVTHSYGRVRILRKGKERRRHVTSADFFEWGSVGWWKDDDDEQRMGMEQGLSI